MLINTTGGLDVKERVTTHKGWITLIFHQNTFTTGGHFYYTDIGKQLLYHDGGFITKRETLFVYQMCDLFSVALDSFILTNTPQL